MKDKPKNRWYDQEPNCTKLLVHLRTIKDDEVRMYCARMIHHFGEGVRKEIQYKNTAGVTSIGQACPMRASSAPTKPGASAPWSCS